MVYANVNRVSREHARSLSVIDNKIASETVRYVHVVTHAIQCYLKLQ